MDKYKKIKKSGLLDAVEKIHIPVFNFKESDKEFFEEFKKLSNKIEVLEIRKKFNNESDTLNYIKELSENFEQNTPILYMHLKGVSYIDTTTKKHVGVWVRYLDYYCIGDWKLAVKELNNYDTAAPFFSDTHYSGNYFWVNSDYIKTLPAITEQNHQKINRGEYWLSLNKNWKAFEMSGIIFNFNLYTDSFVIPDFFSEGF